MLLAGSGSDEVFVSSVFRGPLAAVGIRLLAPPPRPGCGVVSGMWQDLDAAADHRTLVGGVSLGAHVAASWALRNPGRCAGLLLALPAWLGAPGTAPAAVAAAATADAVCRDGLDHAVRQVRASAPEWLAAELSRAWHRHGVALAQSLRVAAHTAAPTADELGRLDVAAGVAALVDDPLHPLPMAFSWAAAMPRAAVVSTGLQTVGRDRAALGRAAILGWLRAASRPTRHHL